MDQYPYPKYQFEITPLENWNRFVKRQEFCWVPDVYNDFNCVCPDCNPDNIACGFDGGLDSFGVRWIPVENNDALPAFVDPKCVILENIADWENLNWPEVDAWDWKKEGEIYRSSLSKERPSVGIMQTGLFERMISLMSFEEAAASLLTDPESTQAFLDRLLETNLSILEHYKQDMDCDVIIFHDDWGAQRSPFFSAGVVEKFFVPHLKRLTKRAHELDMTFILHSCGNITSFVPLMIEAGIDCWQFNYDAVKDTILDTIRKYGDQILFHGYFGTVAPFSEDNETFKQEVQNYFDSFGRTEACSVSICDYEDRGMDTTAYCNAVS